MPELILVGIFPVVCLGYGPHTQEGELNGNLAIMPETGNIIVIGIQVLFRGILLNKHLGKLFRWMEPEFQGIQEQEDDNVKRQRIYREAQNHENPGKADRHQGHHGYEHYYPEIGPPGWDNKKSSQRNGRQNIVKADIAVTQLGYIGPYQLVKQIGCIEPQK